MGVLSPSDPANVSYRPRCWFVEEGTTLTPDVVAAHLDEILASDDFIVPAGFEDEMALLVETLGR